MKTGECYTVKLHNFKGGVKHLIRGNMTANLEAIIRVEDECHSGRSKPNQHNKRYNITVIKMIKGDKWPYTTMSVNNLKKCKGVFDKAATILYGCKGLDTLNPTER